MGIPLPRGLLLLDAWIHAPFSGVGGACRRTETAIVILIEADNVNAPCWSWSAVSPCATAAAAVVPPRPWVVSTGEALSLPHCRLPAGGSSLSRPGLLQPCTVTIATAPSETCLSGGKHPPHPPPHSPQLSADHPERISRWSTRRQQPTGADAAKPTPNWTAPRISPRRGGIVLSHERRGRGGPGGSDLAVVAAMTAAGGAGRLASGS